MVRTRTKRGGTALGLEALEDRTVLSTATSPGDMDASERAHRGQPAYASSPPAPPAQRANESQESYSIQPAANPAATSSQQAQRQPQAELALVLLSREMGPTQARAPAAVAAPQGPATVTEGPLLLAANRALAVLVPYAGTASNPPRLPPAAPAERPPLPDLPGAEESTSARPAGQPEQQAGNRPSALSLPAGLPGLGVGDWDEAARGFLRALESLGAGAGDRESLWVRLGYWGVAAATVLLLELARQRFGKQRPEEVDAFALRWGFPDPGPGHE
jgi:hypothetical protein